MAQQEFFTKPKFSHIIEPCDCLAAPCDVISLDMYTLQVGDLEVIFYFFYEKVINEPTWILLLMLDCFVSQEMKGEFHFCVEKSAVFHGFTAWFTVCFESLEAGGATVELNTGPNSG